MELKAMTFDGGQLETVTVSMTSEEAAFISKVTGKMNDPMAHDWLGIPTQAHSDIYDTLAGEVFNRLYDDGVDEWIRRK